MSVMERISVHFCSVIYDLVLISFLDNMFIFIADSGFMEISNSIEIGVEEGKFIAQI